MAAPRAAPAAVQLTDGRVLVSGPRSSEILDLATRTWRPGPRSPADPGQLLGVLPGGTVLMVAWRLPVTAPLTECYLLPPGASVWADEGCVPQSVLPQQLVVAGGQAELVGFSLENGSALVARYSQADSDWALLPSLASGRPATNAIPLRGGRLLVITPDTYGVFDPAVDSYPGVGGALASLQVTLAEGAAALLLLALLAVRWRRSAAQGGLGRTGEVA